MTRIRVLVVDDSVVIRRIVSDLLSADPAIEVVGTAVNGRAALTKIGQLEPDLVTMDIEMPELDGIGAVRALRASGNKVPVIMFSTLTEAGAVATLDALAAGASDYVPKPANVGKVGQSIEQVRAALIPRIKALVPQRGRSAGAAAPAQAPRSTQLRPAAATPAGGHRLLVIGSSTGGPDALTTLFATLPPLPVPVAVVQHMPALFTRQLAARLDRQFDFDVVEAEEGQVLRPGMVVIAQGDHHLEIDSQPGGGLACHLTMAPPENYCRPAVDVLFRSAVAAVGPAVLAAVLTGMGSDGCRGAQAIVERGGSVLAQDRTTSVVWGMPGAVAGAGLAEAVLPLPAIGPEIVRRLAPQHSSLIGSGARR